MIHIYYGEGKGKTTAALGLALRCAGGGGRVLIYQFLKNGSSSETAALKNIFGIDYMQPYPDAKLTSRMNEAERKAAADYYTKEFEIIKTKAACFDMVILDEIIPAVNAGFISLTEVTNFIKSADSVPEIILTGRKPSAELLELADYITEMKKIRHPFDKGVKARKYIER